MVTNQFIESLEINTMISNMPQRHNDTKNHKDRFEQLSPEEEGIGKVIVNAAYKLSATLCLSVLVANLFTIN